MALKVRHPGRQSKSQGVAGRQPSLRAYVAWISALGGEPILRCRVSDDAMAPDFSHSHDDDRAGSANDQELPPVHSNAQPLDLAPGRDNGPGPSQFAGPVMQTI